MERLRQLFHYIQRQISLLNVSQRIAIGLCAAMAAGSVLWLLQWSTTPDMVPLLSHDFTLEELNSAENALQSSGVTYKISGGRILVSSQDRYDVLRVLHTSNALPDGSLFDMQAVVSDENPFQSPESREYAQNYAKGNELAKIIATWPQIKRASVLLNPNTRRRLGGTGDEPTASVTIVLANGQSMNTEMVEAFAKLVSGSVSGLKPHNVNVVDGRTIQSYNVPRPEEAHGLDSFRIAPKHEERMLVKIRHRLSDIPGLLATVSVELDSSRRVKQTNLHDAPQPKTESQVSSEETTNESGAEPGVQANIGEAITAGGAGLRHVSEESKVENFEPKIRETETVEQGPTIKRATASISIPRSFIVGVFRATRPDAVDPKDDDPQFAAVRDEQVARVKSSVEKIIMAKSPNDVQVDVYPDVEWGDKGPTWQKAPGEAAAQSAVGSLDAISVVREYGSSALLGMLAIFSLFLMTRVVRKSSEVVTTTAAYTSESAVMQHGEPELEPMLTVASSTIGQAAEGDNALIGREVDDESLRFAELTSEVSKMVEEDPRATAEMLRRWLQ